MAIHKVYNDRYAWVVIDSQSGFLELYTHDGHKVNGNIFIRVQDSFNGPNTAIVKLTCNIAGSIEEMNDKIKESENSRNQL